MKKLFAIVAVMQLNLLKLRMLLQRNKQNRLLPQ